MNSIFVMKNIECEKGIPLLKDGSVDLVCCSPPYNVDLGNNKYNKTPYDMYNDNRDHWDYIDWLTLVFKLIYPKLRSGARVCLNIGDGRNGRVPTHSDVIQMLCGIDYIPMQTIIWNKAQTSNRTAWGSYLSPSSPALPAQFEYILVFAKETLKLQTKGVSDLRKKEFIEWTNPIWRFLPDTNQKKIGGIAVFPEELPKRCIKMYSWRGATVLDPFAGSFTTGVVCKKLKRSFIGFEKSKTQYEIGARRINQV